MSYLLLSNQDRLAFSKNWAWFFLWGIALIILGIVAISAATMTTLISVVFLGAILFISGVVIIFDAFKYWWHKWNGFFLHIIMGILYLAAGSFLFESPMLGSISLTLILGIFYIMIGVFRVAYSLALQLPRWGWSFFNGIVSLLLGLLIVGNWPNSSLFIIGLFIGIDLVVCGWAYLMLGVSARMITNQDRA